MEIVGRRSFIRCPQLAPVNRTLINSRSFGTRLRWATARLDGKPCAEYVPDKLVMPIDITFYWGAILSTFG